MKYNLTSKEKLIGGIYLGGFLIGKSLVAFAIASSVGPFKVSSGKFSLLETGRISTNINSSKIKMIYDT